jgi:hypothetical protein
MTLCIMARSITTPRKTTYYKVTPGIITSGVIHNGTQLNDNLHSDIRKITLMIMTVRI